MYIALNYETEEIVFKHRFLDVVTDLVAISTNELCPIHVKEADVGCVELETNADPYHSELQAIFVEANPGFYSYQPLKTKPKEELYYIVAESEEPLVSVTNGIKGAFS